MNATPNEGDRPSGLDLDRFATGELRGPERARVQAWIDTNPAGLAWLDGLRQARNAVRPLDIAAVRERAARIEVPVVARPTPMDENLVDESIDDDVSENVTLPFLDERAEFPPSDAVLSTSAPGVARVVSAPIPAAPQAPARPASRRFGPPWVLAPALALAAVMGLVVLPQVLGTPEIGLKGAGDLEVYELAGGVLNPYAGGALGAGDTVGFQVTLGSGGEGLVLLSIDGRGEVQVFRPERGEDPEVLPRGAGGAIAVPGTVILDGAPGPEVFVVVFDRPVSEAREAVEVAYRRGGTDGVLAWAGSEPGVDAVAVEKR
jgi:hypothetical protein